MAKATPTDATVVALLKKHPDQSMQFYADKLGIPLGGVGVLVWKNEPVADPSLKIPATEASVVKARDGGMRWERIAARCGKTVSEVKKLYEAKTGTSAAESYTGRGRPVGGTSGTIASKRGGRKTQATSSNSGTSGRRGKASSTAKTGSTAKRGGKNVTAKAGAKAAGRRGTRASATAADPK